MADGGPFSSLTFYFAYFCAPNRPCPPGHRGARTNPSRWAGSYTPSCIGGDTTFVRTAGHAEPGVCTATEGYFGSYTGASGMTASRVTLRV